MKQIDFTEQCPGMPRDNDLVETLKDIGGLKPGEHDPFAHWDGKTNCPYCPQRFNTLTALDHHIATHDTGRF